tara:strand:+ start:553 stop:1254 length:702 start_codon:yes stop_codon:yes gene_type:complete
MGDLTDNNPKCLVNISQNGEETLLGHQIKNLQLCGINQFIITTGPFEGKIITYVNEKFPNLDVIFINNEKYKNTNYIYSMWIIKEYIDDDIILMHGDLVFEKTLLKKIINSKYKNSVLVNDKIPLPEKDFKGRVINGLVKEIGVNVFREKSKKGTVHFLAPIYFFSKNSFDDWLEEIGKFVYRNELSVYAENAFNNISNKIDLNPIYYSEEFCMEIDNQEDLEIVRENFNKLV